MIQTLEEGMKNQSKCITIPREIRPFDIRYRIVNKQGQPLALKKWSKYIRFTLIG